jgi:hypothetical protein
VDRTLGFPNLNATATWMPEPSVNTWPAHCRVNSESHHGNLKREYGNGFDARADISCNAAHNVIFDVFPDSVDCGSDTAPPEETSCRRRFSDQRSYQHPAGRAGRADQQGSLI